MPREKRPVDGATLRGFTLRCGLAAIGLFGMPAFCLAEGGMELVAGPPLILKHPIINDSIGNPVHGVAFVDGGTSLATGATSGVLIWDTSTGQLRQTLELDQRSVDSLTLDPRGKLLVAGGASGIINVWDAGSFKLLHTLGPTPGAVRGLSISPDGKTLASTSPNGQKGAADSEFGIFLWDLTTGHQLRTIPHPPPVFGVTALAFTTDGRQIITGQDRAFRVLDVQTGKVTKLSEQPGLTRSIGCLALSPDGRRLATGVFEAKLRLWDAQSWQEILAWNAHDQQPPPKFGVSSVGFSPDGKYLLSGGLDGMICVWDAASGRRLLELDARGEQSSKWITGVAITSNNALLAASHFAGTATLWRISERPRE